jgi:molybdopterin/thiamine biosynthesis adenylyltransferase
MTLNYSIFSVAMPEAVDLELRRHLIRPDGQEDICFALWTPSRGLHRETALVHTVILPAPGERQVHGNASFNPEYLERVAELAVAEKCGIAFLHSHPSPGWQGMSLDDVHAERDVLAGAVGGLTDLPLVGLTAGTDASWSARFWQRTAPKRYERFWCESVRVVGEQLATTFCDEIAPALAYRDLFRRTVTVWGEQNHANLARLRIGIVGLGSVGSIVAETLARMGLGRLTLIDFDRIEPHNLDRLLFATEADVGRLKVGVAAERVRSVATAAAPAVQTVPFSLVEEAGYRAALDCDALFSCVDRPRARHILNHFAYSHLIPVIDGGIEVRFKNARFSGVDWQLQTVGPGRACLECLGAYNPDDVSVEAAGKLDDPSYLKNLPPDHRFKRNENVFPFSANLASLEVIQFVALATGLVRLPNLGVQRYRYIPGTVEASTGRLCTPDCETARLLAQGDRFFTLSGRDLAAEKVRLEPQSDKRGE